MAEGGQGSSTAQGSKGDRWPDATARQHQSRAGAAYVALRFSGGTGPALLGVPADEVRDQTPDLEELWASAEPRLLAEQVAEDPVATLQAWAVDRAASREVDPLGPKTVQRVTVRRSIRPI
jgi:hypothetical protein